MGCAPEDRCDCLKGSGEVISEVRAIEQFDKLEINNTFIVNIIQDSLPGIVVAAGENLLPEIITRVENGTLIIENKNTCNWVREYRDIYITLRTTDVREIVINGESKLYSSDTLFLNKLLINVYADIAVIDMAFNLNEIHLNVHAGTGDFTLKGVTQSGFYYIHGTGYLWADRLHAKYVDFNHNSTGDFHINSSKILIARLHAPGNAYFSGDPDSVYIAEKSSTGLLIKVP
ncbi:MAG: DUF2807 domain-containing protein [Bacteroidota bacterium]